MHLSSSVPTLFFVREWDLDGNELIDNYYLDLDDAVKEVMTSCNMSTLNTPEEVWLAEKLLEINQ